MTFESFLEISPAAHHRESLCDPHPLMAKGIF